jgi:hypothetical protein
MYGKFENGKFVQPPRKLLNVPRTFEDEDGNPVTGLYNVGYDPAVEPEPEVVAYLTENGYLPVVESQRPEDGDGYYYVAGYELVDDHFVQVWERVDDPPPDPNPEISAERALGIILTGRDSNEAE